jgi:outer membrane autotransporter protein
MGKMKKSKLMVVVSSLLAAVQPLHSTDKPYIGIAVGQTSSIFNLTRFMASERKDSSSIGKHGYSAGVFAGYNHLIKESPLFVGIELGARTHNMEVIKQDSILRAVISHTTKVRSKNSLSAVFKMGVVVKDLLVYGKAGLAQTNFQVSFEDATTNVVPVQTLQNFKKNGTVFGFGVDYTINPNWAIGADYAIANYQKLKLTHPVGKLHLCPSLQTTTFRLSYMF